MKNPSRSSPRKKKIPCADFEAVDREYQQFRDNPLYQRKPTHTELKDIRRWLDPLRASFHRSEVYRFPTADLPQKRKIFRALVEASPLLWWDEATFLQSLSPFPPLIGIESDEDPSFCCRLLTERVLYQEITRKALRLANSVLREPPHDLFRPNNLPLWTWIVSILGVDALDDRILRYKLTMIERASHRDKPLAWMFAPSEVIRRTGTKIIPEQLKELYEWNKERRPIFREVWAAFFWSGGGRHEGGRSSETKNPQPNRESASLTKATKRWIKKYDDWLAELGEHKRAYDLTLKAFDKGCRIKDPHRRAKARSKLIKAMEKREEKASQR